MPGKTTKSMNVILWVLQALFAVYFIIGAVYMMNNYRALASTLAADFAPAFWIILGIIQILFAAGLVLPAITKKQTHAAISAIGLAVISLFGIVLYSAYSGVGVLWGLIPAIVLGFIAYQRR